MHFSTRAHWCAAVADDLTTNLESLLPDILLPNPSSEHPLISVLPDLASALSMYAHAIVLYNSPISWVLPCIRLLASWLSCNYDFPLTAPCPSASVTACNAMGQTGSHAPWLSVCLWPWLTPWRSMVSTVQLMTFLFDRCHLLLWQSELHC